jgi:hypothetical protein
MLESAPTQIDPAGSIARDGYFIVPKLLGRDEVCSLIEATRTALTSGGAGVLMRDREVYGVRDSGPCPLGSVWVSPGLEMLDSA